MARQNLRQHQLATALGLPQTSISKRLSGSVPFDVVELEKTAAFLGVPVTQLLGDKVPVGTPPPSPPPAPQPGPQPSGPGRPRGATS